MKVPVKSIYYSMGRRDFVAIRQLGENLSTFLCDVSLSQPASLDLFLTGEPPIY